MEQEHRDQSDDEYYFVFGLKQWIIFAFSPCDKCSEYQRDPSEPRTGRDAPIVNRRWSQRQQQQGRGQQQTVARDADAQLAAHEAPGRIGARAFTPHVDPTAQRQPTDGPNAGGDRHQRLILSLLGGSQGLHRDQRMLPDTLKVAPEIAKGITELSEEKVMDLLKRYQKGEEDVKILFREVAGSVLRGFTETLSRMGITYDQFDWESELIWESWVNKALSKLEESGYLGREGNAIYVDLRRALKEREDIRNIFGLSYDDVIRLEREGKLDEVVPSKFYLTRSDGTWLYTGTDVAYSLYKTEMGVSRCYNVIATEQTLEQKEVRASLSLMGYDPDFLVHLAYEMVNLIGIKMSGRRAKYITLDDLLNEAKEKVMEILRPDLKRGGRDTSFCGVF